jgi:thiopeptide-type bacteriocin biosynthesis protein
MGQAVSPVVKKEPSPALSGSLYEPLDFLLVRAPLLPVESYLGLRDEQRRAALLSDPRVRRALAVGSASLLGAIDRFNQSGLTRRDADRMRSKLLRYQIRMSTRPTPYGLFAGVALGSWNASTDLRLTSTCVLTRTRPDMAWLMEFVIAAESKPEIRKHLRFFANPLVFIAAGRVSLAERTPPFAGNGVPVSIRATGVVKRALTLARHPLPYEDLVSELCGVSSSATPEKVEKLLTELWQQTFLLSDLRPPLTTGNPAGYVAERLARIPEAASDLQRLEAFLGAAVKWDSLEAEKSVQMFGQLLSHAGVPADGSKEVPIQVDMAMSLAGGLGDVIAAEAARAAELLLRLSPSPRGGSSIAAYRQAFINRYGHDREVPLLELLDPDRGLGPPSMHGHAAVGPERSKSAQRAQTLLHLACAALHRRLRVVFLDEKLLPRLETCTPDSEIAPRSLDINILVAARSTAAIDAGDFTVVVGPNLGAFAAGRNLGRFADALGPDGQQSLQRAAAAEQAHAPDNIWAEVVYLPSNLRSANVVIHPQVWSHEVALGVSPGVPESSVIPLDELTVGVEHSRFYVRWPAAGKRITFSYGHMLNLHQAPAVGRFLVDIGIDNKTIFSSFDWGPAESFPYLPRVQAGRIVLSPAQWRIYKDDLPLGSLDGFLKSLDEWRREWEAPQYVCVAVADNRLVIDLDREAEAAELHAELQKLSDGGFIVVQEVLPSLEEAWLRGPEGRYYSEFCVPLVLRRSSAPAVSRAAESPIAEIVEYTDSRLVRTHPPGSEWLFVKLYGPRNLEEDLISGSMLTFANNVVASGLADSWFYVRYSDPDPHLRLRFHGQPERLTSQLFGQVCEWARSLMADELCIKYVFDTYEQEIERFGGSDGMAAAEALFAADSRFSAELIRLSRANHWPHDRTALVAVSIDQLLGGLGLDEADRLRWYRDQTTAGPDTGAEYRQRKNVLRSLLGRPISEDLGADRLVRVFETAQTALIPIGQRFRELARRGDLKQSLDTLCSSFVHLHVNRLAGVDALPEQRILGLLVRTREGLAKAPLRAASG